MRTLNNMDGIEDNLLWADDQEVEKRQLKQRKYQHHRMNIKMWALHISTCQDIVNPTIKTIFVKSNYVKRLGCCFCIAIWH